MGVKRLDGPFALATHREVSPAQAMLVLLPAADVSSPILVHESSLQRLLENQTFEGYILRFVSALAYWDLGTFVPILAQRYASQNAPVPLSLACMLADVTMRSLLLPCNFKRKVRACAIIVGHFLLEFDRLFWQPGQYDDLLAALKNAARRPPLKRGRETFNLERLYYEIEEVKVPGREHNPRLTLKNCVPNCRCYRGYMLKWWKAYQYNLEVLTFWSRKGFSAMV
jgi:hypothetical protein